MTAYNVFVRMDHRIRRAKNSNTRNENAAFNARVLQSESAVNGVTGDKNKAEKENFREIIHVNVLGSWHAISI